jgi:hypothetical protein
MKLSILFAIFVSTVSAEAEGNVRQRRLTTASGEAKVECFSEIATVDVLGKGSVQMKNLEVGDRVFTGESYESVYAFAHKLADVKGHFLQIETDNGSSLEITGDHLMFVDGQSSAVRAESVKVGDALSGARVTKVGAVERNGIYAPFTTDGKLVVDGVKASSYALPVALNGGYLQEMSHYGISPFRLLCTKVSSSYCEANTADGIPSVLASIKNVTEWALAQPLFAQIFIFAAFFLGVCVSFAFECILSVPFALTSLAIFTAALMAANKVSKKVVA